MAIPATPPNYYAQQGDGRVWLQWDLVAGATSYSVQRSTDGVTYSVLASPATNGYEDLTAIVGTFYYYQVASTNLSGTSPYTDPQSITPTLGGEMSLAELGVACLRRADRLNSGAIPLPQLNDKINKSLAELYDLLITSFETYYKAPNAIFTTTTNQQIYPMPNGALSFTTDLGATFVPAPIYKLLGVDLSAGSTTNGSLSNSWLTVEKYNFIDRNRYLYPQTGSQIYGILGLAYRWMGSAIEFIPTPSANQQIRLQYIPKLPILLKPYDITTTNVSGWLEYVIIDVAMKIITEEEGDVSTLGAEKLLIKERIEAASQNRDVGRPDTISDSRRDGFGGNGYNGFGGGF